MGKFHLSSILLGVGSFGLCAVLPSVTTFDLILKVIITVASAIPTVLNFIQRKKIKESEKETSK